MVQKPGRPAGAGLPLVAGDGSVGNLKKHLEACEQELLRRALVQTGGNRSRAACFWAYPARVSTAKPRSGAFLIHSVS